jgi:DNA-directed RNA polymerase specialized sigma24 family protein
MRIPFDAAETGSRQGEDLRLWRRLEASDVGALAALYDAHSPVAYRLASAMLADGSLAAEALEAGFLNLWERARSGSASEGLSPAASVLRFVYRACVERRPSAPAQHGVLDALPDEQRLAIVLAQVGRLTVEETAAVLGRRADQVRRDLLLGLRAVRELAGGPASGDRLRPAEGLAGADRVAKAAELRPALEGER